jgi:uncharacterized protein (TIGR03437 family)
MKLKINAFILVLGTAAACLGQRSYTATPVSVPAYSIANLFWISDDGTTGFGAGIQLNPFAVQCFTYLNGAITVIPTPGFPNCQPQAANTGEYLAYLSQLVNNIGPPNLVSFTNGNFNLLSPPQGVTNGDSLAGQYMGLNKSGQLAGTFYRPAPAGFNGSWPCAYVISNSGAFTRLPDLGGPSGATAINDSGDAAGWVSRAGDTIPTTSTLSIWPHTGGRIDIASFTNIVPQDGALVSINAKGQVAGANFFYDGLGNTKTIQVSGASQVSAWSMNNNGEVVGTYQTAGLVGVYYPFYYANGVATDLNAAVTNLPPGVFLSTPSYINNAGQILVTAIYATQAASTTPKGAFAAQYLLTPTDAATNPPAIGAVLNAGSLVSGVSSSAWITIQGLGLSETTRSWTAADMIGNQLPTKLDGVSVTVNGLPAYPSYISPTQLNVLAPQDPATGPVQVQVTNAQGTSKVFTVTKSDPMPAFFSNTPYVLATHADGTLVGVDSASISGPGYFSPALPGETITIYGTGFGVAMTPAPSGQVMSAPAALANTVSITIGGVPAVVVYAGVLNGTDQLNVTIPTSLPSYGTEAVIATVNGVSTQTNLSMLVELPGTVLQPVLP